MMHLSPEEISQWMMGERTMELERHLAECHACRAELEQLEAALVQFRASVRESSAVIPPVWREPDNRAAWLSWPRLVLAAAALLILVALPISWRSRAQERAAEAAIADSQLLERVDSAISQAVPEPMEPLVSLVTWNSAGAEQNRKVEKQ